MSKIIFLILVILISASFFFFKKPVSSKSLEINIKGQKFSLEIANSTISRTKGLSGRDSLCQHCGMIFIYQKESIYPFWMKNTRIPLDIIWLDSNGKIVDIKTGQPQSLSVLKNSTPARYIIETNLSASNLSVGDIIKLPHDFN